jgi:hypothetical protein
MFSCSYKFNIYLQQHSFNKRYIKASRRREMSWIIIEGLLPASPDILRALIIIGPSGHHHGLLPLGLLLRLLSGLLLLPSNMDISSQYLVLLPCLLKFFLS